MLVYTYTLGWGCFSYHWYNRDWLLYRYFSIDFESHKLCKIKRTMDLKCAKFFSIH
jgi:hypothetical protein